MISAIVIDDEVAIREGMLRHIPWKKLGVDQVEAIDSAEKAVEYLETRQPDLIISDIRLPKMDGIRLAELIREKQLNCRILFMSAYTDLEYFRGAIRLSVEAYIEKPIDIDRMEREIQKVVEKLLRDRKQKETELLAQNIIDLHTEHLYNCVLKNLFRGHWNETLMERLNQEKLCVRQDDTFLCMVVKTKTGDDSRRKKVCNALERKFHTLRHIICDWETRVTVCLLAFTQNDFLTEGSRLLEEFRAEFEKGMFEQEVLISVSERRSGWREIPFLYQQAVCQMQKLFFVGYHHLLLPERSGNRLAEREKIPFRQISEALDAREEQETLRLAEEIYQNLREKTDTLPAIVKDIFYQLVSMVLDKTGGMSPERPVGEQEENFIWFRISNFETISECYEYLMETIENCFRNEEEFVYDSRAVNGAIRYIKKYFGNPEMSVRDIAEEVRLTPQYMTSIFKKKTGITVGQFIRETRMDYSRRLIQNSDLSLTRIAELSGYMDENYWAKVYKKEYGQSPSEFRRRMRG